MDFTNKGGVEAQAGDVQRDQPIAKFLEIAISSSCCIKTKNMRKYPETY